MSNTKKMRYRSSAVAQTCEERGQSCALVTALLLPAPPSLRSPRCDLPSTFLGKGFRAGGTTLTTTQLSESDRRRVLVVGDSQLRRIAPFRPSNALDAGTSWSLCHGTTLGPPPCCARQGSGFSSLLFGLPLTPPSIPPPVLRPRSPRSHGIAAVRPTASARCDAREAADGRSNCRPAVRRSGEAADGRSNCKPAVRRSGEAAVIDTAPPRPGRRFIDRGTVVFPDRRSSPPPHHPTAAVSLDDPDDRAEVHGGRWYGWGVTHY